MTPPATSPTGPATSAPAPAPRTPSTTRLSARAEVTISDNPNARMNASTTLNIRESSI